MKILFVCTGNICRSPMAEIIFANLCKRNGREDIIIKGAGTSAQPGEEMTPEAREALKICGERVSNKPKPSIEFSKFMLDAYDYIIAMTYRHKDIIGTHKNVYCLDEFVGCGDIADPYLYSIGFYVKICRQLQDALVILYRKIVEGGGLQKNRVTVAGIGKRGPSLINKIIKEKRKERKNGSTRK